MLFELLSKEDKTFMERYIDEFAVSGASKKRADLDYLMRFWDSAKSEFLYRLLGNSFTISKNIEIHRTTDEISDQIDTQCFGWRRPGVQFYDDYIGFIKITYMDEDDDGWRWHTTDPSDWDVNNPNCIYWALRRLIESSTLATNCYDGPSVVVQIPARPDKPFRLNHGAKASKAIGQLVDLWGLNKENYEKFRIAHSMCLNERSFNDKLTISIHPIDYMTMSDNENDWQSCMNWMDGGEYKRGTVEMMNSSMVVVAYIASKHNKLSPWGEYGPSWNSKTWRELFIVTPATIAGIKGYPFWNRDLEAQTIMFLRELAQTNLNWGPYNCEPITFTPSKKFLVDEFKKEYELSFTTDAMYNDFYSDHQCIVTYNTAPSNNIHYSGESECLCCGSALDYDDFEGEEFLFCRHCDGTVQCSCCNCRDYAENFAIVDDLYFCDDCYDNYVVRCPECEDDHYEDNMYKINIAFSEVGILKNWSVLICYDCYNNFAKKGILKQGRLNPSSNDRFYYSRSYDYILWDDLTENLKDELCYGDDEALERAKKTQEYSIVRWDTVTIETI